MDPLKTNPSPEDVDLIAAIRSGGPAGDKAIIALYGRYQKDVRMALRQIIHRFTPGIDPPADILHDAYIIMIRKVRHENAFCSHPRSFWVGIARKLWLNQIKKYKNADRVEDADIPYGMYAPDPENVLIAREREREIEACIAGCGRRCQEVLYLWLADFSMQEIADRLHLSSAGMARKIKHECFKKLKEKLINSNVFNI
jgi:RNA polymerase sigma factor (sigma-70 family)